MSALFVDMFEGSDGAHTELGPLGLGFGELLLTSSIAPQGVMSSNSQTPCPNATHLQ